jgi:hypothetical protein
LFFFLLSIRLFSSRSPPTFSNRSSVRTSVHTHKQFLTIGFIDEIAFTSFLSLSLSLSQQLDRRQVPCTDCCSGKPCNQKRKRQKQQSEQLVSQWTPEDKKERKNRTDRPGFSRSRVAKTDFFSLAKI